MPTAGDTSVYDSTQNFAADTKWVTRFELLEKAEVTNFAFDCEGGPADGVFRAILYADDGGAAPRPTNLLIESGERTITADAVRATVTVTPVTPLVLDPGFYWSGAHLGPGGPIEFYVAAQPDPPEAEPPPPASVPVSLTLVPTTTETLTLTPV